MAALRKPRSERYDRRILLVVTARQRKAWEAEAKRQSISLAEFIRRVVNKSLEVNNA